MKNKTKQYFRTISDGHLNTDDPEEANKAPTETLIENNKYNGNVINGDFVKTEEIDGNPERYTIDYFLQKNISNVFLSKSWSAKFGRRSSISKEIRENLSKNIEITSSDYLVPKLNDTFDLNEIITKESVPNEKFWKRVTDFRSNKGHVKDKKIESNLGESKIG